MRVISMRRKNLGFRLSTFGQYPALILETDKSILNG
jgi:hypothetical protein